MTRQRLGVLLVATILVAITPVAASAGPSQWLRTDAGTYYHDGSTLMMVGTLEAFCTRGSSPADVHVVDTGADRTHLQHHLDGAVELYDAPDGPAALFDTWCPLIGAGGSGPTPVLAGWGTSDLFVTLQPDAASPTFAVEHAHTRATVFSADGTEYRVHARYRTLTDLSTGEATIQAEWIRLG